MAEIEVNNLEEAKEKLAEMRESGEIQNKPTPEETQAAIDAFENAAKAFNEKRFELGDPEKADVIAHFILNFLDKYVYWTKSGWMGVIKLHEEVVGTQSNLKPGEAFSLGYQALEFTYYVLSNPGGHGLDSAREIEKIAENYAEVINLAEAKLKEARETLKEIQWLQDVAASAQQGFFLEKEELPEEEGIEGEAPEVPEAPVE